MKTELRNEAALLSGVMGLSFGGGIKLKGSVEICCIMLRFMSRT